MEYTNVEVGLCWHRNLSFENIWSSLSPLLKTDPWYTFELGNKNLARELVNTCYFSTPILLQIEKNVAEL